MLTEERVARRWKGEEEVVEFFPTDAAMAEAQLAEFRKHIQDQEVDGIVEVLGLKNPNLGDYPRSWDEPGLQSHTKDAISSLFFADPSDSEASGPLKRGPVLLNGERRELMLFPGGFLFSCADLTKFVRDEVRDYFESAGKKLKGTALDRFLRQYDRNPDGSITFEGFVSMMRDMQANHKRRKSNSPSNDRGFLSLWSHPKPKTRTDGISWRSLDKRIHKALARTNLPQKLDVAFQMADVEKIEIVRGSHHGPHFSDPVGLPLALALHIKAVEAPLVVTCEDPRHLEAWAEEFSARISRLTSTSPGASSDTKAKGLQQPNQGPIQKVQSNDCFKVIEDGGNDIVPELNVSEDDSYPELFSFEELDDSGSESIDSTYVLLAGDW